MAAACIDPHNVNLDLPQRIGRALAIRWSALADITGYTLS